MAAGDRPVDGPARYGAGTTVGFVGLGNMGTPMSRRLAEAGYAVRGYDVDARARETLAAVPNTTAVPALGDVAAGAGVVVLILPDSDVVERVVLQDGLLAAMAPGTTLIDMSSSVPTRTRALAERTAERGVVLLDAPVSGGVPGARAGTLTVMVGGPAGAVERARPLLEVFGSRVLHVGLVGAGHALKALNNLMSAAHLLASSEALLVGREFGLDPAVMLEAVNGSSGRSGSTENKWPNYVLTGSYDAGFGARLMVKDVRIAVELARALGMPARLAEAVTELWEEALEHLGADADHTEIVRWLEHVYLTADRQRS